jgi:hypothetical protein
VGGDVSSLTYREQMLDPRWQRRRLEMLNAAGWACAQCDDGSRTLHVHHRQYFKGRLLWEYSDLELVVLCDVCHSVEHTDLESLKALLAIIPAGEIAGLVAGYRSADDWIEPALIEAGRAADNIAFAAGYIAHMVGGLGFKGMLKVATYAASLMDESSEERLHFEHSRGATFGEKAA